MKKFLNADIDRRVEITERLRLAKAEVDEEVFKFNKTVHEAQVNVEGAWNELRAVLSDARDFRDEIIERMSEYQGERSDKWQESDAGVRYESFKEQWESAELDLDEVEFAEDLTVPDELNEEVLEELPESP
jgi:hypothetical protein